MKIALGADHAGYPLKTAVAKHLAGLGHDVSTWAPIPRSRSTTRPSAPPSGERSLRARPTSGSCSAGSGQGEQIAANKVHGVRAALCFNEFTARLAREHNDANVLSLGGRILGAEFALAIVDAFLETKFEGGRHERRVGQISRDQKKRSVRT